jgi:hypothetical protein
MMRLVSSAIFSSGECSEASGGSGGFGLSLIASSVSSSARVSIAGDFSRHVVAGSSV